VGEPGHRRAIGAPAGRRDPAQRAADDVLHQVVAERFGQVGETAVGVAGAHRAQHHRRREQAEPGQAGRRASGEKAAVDGAGDHLPGQDRRHRLDERPPRQPGQFAWAAADETHQKPHRPASWNSAR
jgi:hypothetical protein